MFRVESLNIIFILLSSIESAWNGQTVLVNSNMRMIDRQERYHYKMELILSPRTCSKRKGVDLESKVNQYLKLASYRDYISRMLLMIHSVQPNFD